MLHEPGAPCQKNTNPLKSMTHIFSFLILESVFYKKWKNSIIAWLIPGNSQKSMIVLLHQKNYPSTYSSTFLCILSVEYDFNFIFCLFCVFVYGPKPKNENTESVESFRKFHLLYQRGIIVTLYILIIWY